MRFNGMFVACVAMVGMSGCVVADGSGLPGDERGPRFANEDSSQGPAIVFAEAEGRSWDGGYWQLDAAVDEGGAPVTAVKMTFYDEAHGGCFVERVELFPSEWVDGEWELDWRGSHEVLDPWHDHYTVLVTATDADGYTDEVRIWPDAL